MAKAPKDKSDSIVIPQITAPAGVNPEKWGAVQAAMARINGDKNLGGGKHKITTGDKLQQVGRIRSGILSVDILSGGGIPKSRATQFEGKESSFKTGTTFAIVKSV